MTQDSSTDDRFQQPRAPENELCWHCDKALDHLHGMAWWAERWWCLRCFLRW